MPDLLRQCICLLPQRSFGCPLMRDVGVHADPFDDLAGLVENRQGAYSKLAPSAIMEESMLASHLVDHLNAAKKLAQLTNQPFVVYLIQMAIDAAIRASRKAA